MFYAGFLNNIKKSRPLRIAICIFYLSTIVLKAGKERSLLRRWEQVDYQCNDRANRNTAFIGFYRVNCG